ncbi:ABC transporter permease [Pseudalkalibacillus berkeleyi]|uniref:Transport permease protein n=1 Tax=Pseudalkalibacillus berkeleyi TaxID=1069813 RepID=A0ABS9H3X7_9BACL|nr:ABC transporter permease [Pseudalkalibacillus berkeleyi]MCF6138776.1 ABC transporter permease [Pseudalkalibacillus berkeleyi]
MKSVFTIIKEQWNSIYLIGRLSLYEVKAANNNNYLGMLWEVINPMIQISIYWFVFGYGIYQREAIGDIPYLPWMLSGIILWFFINPAILEATKSIYKKIKMISKMSFPLSVIPSYVIVGKFYVHIALALIVFIMLQFLGFPVSIYMIQLPYFVFATFALLIAIALITSTLATIVRDVQMIVQAVMRMMLYLTPFLWSPERLPEWIQNIMMANPFYYIVNGYRASFLGTSWYMVENVQYTLYYWGLVLVLLVIGSMLHVRFRNHFVDYL